MTGGRLSGEISAPGEKSDAEPAEARLAKRVHEVDAMLLSCVFGVNRWL